jgi:hypothetical protein
MPSSWSAEMHGRINDVFRETAACALCSVSKLNAQSFCFMSLTGGCKPAGHSNGDDCRNMPLLTEGDFDLGKLLSRFGDGAPQIIASLRHRPRTSRVGKMARIKDLGAIFLGAYLGFQRTRHFFKIGDRGYDLLDPLARGVDADLPQAIEPLANLRIPTIQLAGRDPVFGCGRPEAASVREIPAVRN